MRSPRPCRGGASPASFAARLATRAAERIGCDSPSTESTFASAVAEDLVGQIEANVVSYSFATRVTMLS